MRDLNNIHLGRVIVCFVMKHRLYSWDCNNRWTELQSYALKSHFCSSASLYLPLISGFIFYIMKYIFLHGDQCSKIIWREWHLVVPFCLLKPSELLKCKGLVFFCLSLSHKYILMHAYIYTHTYIFGWWKLLLWRNPCPKNSVFSYTQASGNLCQEVQTILFYLCTSENCPNAPILLPVANSFLQILSGYLWACLLVKTECRRTGEKSFVTIL